MITNESTVMGSVNGTSNYELTPLKWSAISFQIILMIVAILGNSIVIIAIMKNKSLRLNLTYRFLVSLAVADLLMGSIVMPLAIMNSLNQYSWPFGQVLCDIWRATDVLSSTASILNLCAISIERYWAIENPIAYASSKTVKKCNNMLIFVWLSSLVISYPAIFWWNYIRDTSNTNRCDFTTNMFYLIFSSFVSFYIPLVVMIVTYTKIFQTASFVIKSMKNGSIVVDNLKSPKEAYSQTYLRVHCGRPKSNNYNFDKTINGGYLQEKNLNKSKILSKLYERTGKFYKNKNFSNNNLRTIKFHRERKAAKTLGIIMGLLIACWLPFFLCNITVAINSEFASQYELVMEVVTWLGYFNSILNPIIYARSMRELRREFISLLLCKKICQKKYPKIFYGYSQNKRYLSKQENYMSYARVDNAMKTNRSHNLSPIIGHKISPNSSMSNQNTSPLVGTQMKRSKVSRSNLNYSIYPLHKMTLRNSNVNLRNSDPDSFRLLYNFHTYSS